MTNEEFYRLMLQMEVDAHEFAKDKGEFKGVVKSAYIVGANSMIQKIMEKNNIKRLRA